MLTTSVILVIILVYWVIPTYIPKDEQYIATQFALVSASILTLILNILTYAFEPWENATEKLSQNLMGIGTSGLFLN